MKGQMQGPWTEGPKELLQHAIDHLAIGGDFDRRIALISIDNAVELAIRTFLSISKRAKSGIGPSRAEIETTRNSFPTMLDLFEKYGAAKIPGVKLQELEWYHRIRNQLYHSGQGMTVERSVVDTYLGIASTLLECLFDEKLSLERLSQRQNLLSKYLLAWANVEGEFRRRRPPKEPGEYAYYWNRECLGRINKRAVALWDKLEMFHRRAMYESDAIELPELATKAAEAEELFLMIKNGNMDAGATQPSES